MEDTTKEIFKFYPLIEKVLPVATFFLGWYIAVQNSRRRRRKLVNAVYYHVDLAIRSLQEQEKDNEAIREKFENDESYTPYLVRSPNDDLTYDHVIEVMEWLDPEGEEAVSSYFHSQQALHALAESFKLEFVRNWPPERKLRAWDAYERFRRDTIEHARRTEEALEERRLHRWWERPFAVIVKRKRKGS